MYESESEESLTESAIEFTLIEMDRHMNTCILELGEV